MIKQAFLNLLIINNNPHKNSTATEARVAYLPPIKENPVSTDSCFRIVSEYRIVSSITSSFAIDVTRKNPPRMILTILLTLNCDPSLDSFINAFKS